MRWRRRAATSLDVDVPRYRRGASTSNEQRPFTVTADIGGFGLVSIEWYGTSDEDVRDQFARYLYDHDEFAEFSGPGLEHLRWLHVRFNGQRKLLTYRTDWVAGWTVH